ncbi:MAG: hypothetical protein QN120_04295 [Armatimonadota bacterium]|nr:hypothetical protein [Armatimonadota bacterium]
MLPLSPRPHGANPHRARGWARGLIHFHTRFSDGWATVRRAAQIARRRGYDFLVVTDHLRNLKLFTRRTPDDYIRACDRASRDVGIPVIPGGEMEVHWNNPAVEDFSEAHTIAFTIRSLARAGEFDWQTPGTDPFGHWPDSEGRLGTVLALQEKLLAHGVPPAASHQFQHSPLGTRGGYSDYRYDLTRVERSEYLDFFYSGAADILHEAEDLELVADYVRRFHRPKAVYASCDYHVGPEVVPAVADMLEAFPPLRRAYAWLFRVVSSTALRFLAGDPETAIFPHFADEQLTHATYVYLGDRACTEEAIVDALRAGRTCVSRGAFQFEDLDPAPGFAPIRVRGVQISLRAPLTFSRPRPRSVLLFEDGRLIRWSVYAVESPGIEFTYARPDAEPGAHVYQVYVPSKFLSSPIVFDIPPGRPA